VGKGTLYVGKGTLYVGMPTTRTWDANHPYVGSQPWYVGSQPWYEWTGRGTRRVVGSCLEWVPGTRPEGIEPKQGVPVPVWGECGKGDRAILPSQEDPS